MEIFTKMFTAAAGVKKEEFSLKQRILLLVQLFSGD